MSSEKKNARHIDDWNNNDVIAWLKINYVREINNGRASERKKYLTANTEIIF